MPGGEPVTTHRGCRFRADLRFWLNVSSSETTTSAANDKLTVEVRNTAGALLKTIRVQFRRDDQLQPPTTFRVDDVGLS